MVVHFNEISAPEQTKHLAFLAVVTIIGHLNSFNAALRPWRQKVIFDSPAGADSAIARGASEVCSFSRSAASFAAASQPLTNYNYTCYTVTIFG